MPACRQSALVALCLMRLLGRILGVSLTCVVLLVVLAGIWCAVFTRPSVQEARAMLDPGVPETALPSEVTLTLDGAKATFHRGDAGYATLLNVLRAVRSQKSREAAGPYHSEGGRERCGDLAIRSFGVTSHFLIARSVRNPHFLWLQLPHLNRGGYGLSMLIDDGRLTPLVHSTSAQRL